jgi:outer membrane immunogenic protein
MKRILLATTALATTALAVSGGAYAADLAPVRMPLKAPPVVARPFSWTGCYIGGHLGGGWSHANFVDPNDPFGVGLGWFAPTGSGVGIDQGAGILGGGQFGCDYQFANNWVVGIAGDFSWTNLDGSAANPFAFSGGDPFFGGKNGVPATLRDRTDWLASATGRIGYTWGRWMLYGKGGIAWEHSRDSIGPLFEWGNTTTLALCFALIPTTSCNASGTDTATGWTAGMGLAWAFAENWSAGIEYDHYGFGNHTVMLAAAPVGAFGSGGSAPITVNHNIEVVKITLDYHLNWLGR